MPARKGTPKAASAKGGGKGPGGKRRKPGAKGFLKNHRNGLTHIEKQGAIELEEAVSAHNEAKRAFHEDKTEENLEKLEQAYTWRENRELNLNWILYKWKSLDEDG